MAPKETSTVARVVATPAALGAIERLRERRGPIMFYQSGGCCEGSIPLCLEDGELILCDNDVLLGVVGGARFYMDHRQFALWAHTQLVIDVGEGEPEGFSLAADDDKHFVTRSRVLSPQELLELGSRDER